MKICILRVAKVKITIYTILCHIMNDIVRYGIICIVIQY